MPQIGLFIHGRFFDPKFSDSLLSPVSIFTDYTIPLLAIDSDNFGQFLSIYECIKNHNYKCNVIFTNEKIFLHLVSPIYSGKKLGAKECIKIFSTSHEDVFERVRHNMLVTLVAGSFYKGDYLKLMDYF